MRTVLCDGQCRPRLGGRGLFPDDDVSVTFDMTQLVAVEVDHQLPQPGVGGSEVYFHLGIFPRPHRGGQPAG